MNTIDWAIELKCSKGTYFCDYDAKVMFSHELFEGDIYITVEGFENCEGVYFSEKSENVAMICIFNEVKKYLENDGNFLSFAYEQIEDEYYIPSNSNEFDVSFEHRYA